MPKHNKKLTKGNIVFLPLYQSIGKILETSGEGEDKQILIYHYLIQKKITHKINETQIEKIHNKKLIPRYENFEIYTLVTKALKSRGATNRKTALKVFKLELKLPFSTKRIGQAIAYSIQHYNHNPANIQAHPGIGEVNNTRQQYWLDNES